MSRRIFEDLAKQIESKKKDGLYKDERIIESHQGAEITVGGRKVLNFCANNYLGLSSHPAVLQAAKDTVDSRGFGLSSVRFICGTQDIHKQLEKKVSEFLGTDDTILYAACFDANGGVFDPFLDQECAIIADQLNHASIIDGVRLCKAKRYIYSHIQMGTGEYEFDGRKQLGLEGVLQLEEVRNCKYRMIATDGVFSMNGDLAPLDRICELAEKYDALVMVDDSHASGFVGRTGRGTHEYFGVMDKVDLITTTFGKALGGASGGCTSGRAVLIDWLRQVSRPYLFSNTLAPSVVGATIKVLELLSSSTELRDRLESNQKYFRQRMTAEGFEILPGDHAIVPIMFTKFSPDDAPVAQAFANDMLAEGIYVIGFFYPVVAKGQSRIRVQLSAAHTRDHIDKAIAAFVKVGRKHGVI
ncbi:MAG TPA: glycine C-acetyltransferase [Candidatus Fermentibacter daniensis]|jgi:glycine C-acetyltransferase|nr:MAG: 2-amino-3-ketobutyrate CoA ligase [Candidatus Fermentibacter daniensis]MBP7720385.1 glycine C-acetyltransferase [Candidatus Fermentibacter sp.]OQC70694.1 MAG: 2-amino-3-ketobutyrate coenzyme A ligase [candidate division Hyd24-12 bacterium ADurb.Bin004]KZD15542.1 MAG: 2-amino-3-ketobutyrate CoA ligase [Candidatus Fermentibacter daniensis]KZD15901.1 MAG: 2-amino-3-ketobutyrate CoA ligase [Candidatus Fermentibacter daniensis]